MTVGGVSAPEAAREDLAPAGPTGRSTDGLDGSRRDGQLYRAGAWALVLGAAVVTAANLLAPQGNAREAVASGGYYPAIIGVTVGGLILMAGWPVAYLQQRARSGRLGLVSFGVVMVAGMSLTVGFPTILLLMYPWLSSLSISTRTLSNGPDAFNFYFAAASGVVSIGGILFGAATLRARVFSRQLGVAFIVLSAASFVLGFLSLPGGGGIHMSWWWATTGTFGVVAYMVGMGWYGLEVLRHHPKRRPNSGLHQETLGRPEPDRPATLRR